MPALPRKLIVEVPAVAPILMLLIAPVTAPVPIFIVCVEPEAVVPAPKFNVLVDVVEPMLKVAAAEPKFIVVAVVVNKLKERYPNGFSCEDSINRKC
jgi:hypothetical protein